MARTSGLAGGSGFLLALVVLATPAGAQTPPWQPLWLPDPPVSGVCPGCAWIPVVTGVNPVPQVAVTNLTNSNTTKILTCTEACFDGKVAAEDSGLGVAATHGSLSGHKLLTLTHVDFGPCTVCPTTCQIAAVTQPSLVIDAALEADGEVSIDTTLLEDFSVLNSADNLLQSRGEFSAEGGRLLIAAGVQFNPATGILPYASFSWTEARCFEEVPHNKEVASLRKVGVAHAMAEQVYLYGTGSMRALADGWWLDTASASGSVSKATHGLDMQWRCCCASGNCTTGGSTTHTGPLWVGTTPYVPPAGAGTPVLLPASGSLNLQQVLTLCANAGGD